MRLRIVGLGDSTTAGTPGFLSPLEEPPNGRGNPESQYAYWMMRVHPEWVVLNRGINGDRSDGMLARFQCDVMREEAQYVIILAGVNDIYEGVPIESIKTNILAMYQEAIVNGLVPVAATVLPYNTASPKESTSIRELNHWIIDTAKGLRIPFCDTNIAVADPKNPDRLRGSPEGLHPDVTGYGAMGEALTLTIQRHMFRRLDSKSISP